MTRRRGAQGSPAHRPAPATASRAGTTPTSGTPRPRAGCRDDPRSPFDATSPTHASSVECNEKHQSTPKIRALRRTRPGRGPVDVVVVVREAELLIHPHRGVVVTPHLQVD